MHNKPFLYDKKSITYVSSDELVTFSDDIKNRILIPETERVTWFKKYRFLEFSFRIIPTRETDNTDLFYSDTFYLKTPLNGSLCNLPGNNKVEHLLIKTNSNNTICKDTKFRFILIQRMSKLGL
jgi:hypothetical protein